MNVICVICSDLLVQSDDVFYTRCGHVFHLHCLTQWLERSKSCPQCREKVTQSKIHRLYFTFSNNEVVESNSSSLQERIDSLKFQILLKEKDIKYFTSKNVTLEKQNAGLRKEVRKVESEINQKNSAIHALKEQTKYFKEQSGESENLKREVARLKAKLEDLRPIQVLVHAPVNDVDEMIANTRDPDTLIKYISVMKKQLVENLNKRKQLYLTTKRLQEDLSKATAECDSLFEEHSKRMQLQEELEFSQIKNMSLQTRVNELEKMLGITDNENENSDSILAPENLQSSSVENESVQAPKVVHNNKERSHRSSTSLKRRKEKVSLKNTPSIEENISNIQVDSFESTGLEETSVKYTVISDSPIVPKRPRISSDSKDDGTNDTKKSTDSKCSNSLHSKSRRKRGGVTSSKRDKYDKETERETGRVIDLT